jgi:hypothetical protein
MDALRIAGTFAFGLIAVLLGCANQEPGHPKTGLDGPDRPSVSSQTADRGEIAVQQVGPAPVTMSLLAAVPPPRLPPGCAELGSVEPRESDTPAGTGQTPGLPAVDRPRQQAPVVDSSMRPEANKRLPLPFLSVDEMLDHDVTCHILDITGDGEPEVILHWWEDSIVLVASKGAPLHQYRVFRKGASVGHRFPNYRQEAEGAEPPLVPIGAFALEGDMAPWHIRRVQEADPKLPAKVVIAIQYNSANETYYLLQPDGKGARQITVAITVEHVDMDQDGVFEWLFSHKHGHTESVRYFNRRAWVRELFRWDESRGMLVAEWPEEGATEHTTPIQEGSVLVDIDKDGGKEIVALMDPDADTTATRRLRIYRYRSPRLRLVAEIDAVRPHLPVDILEPYEAKGGMRIPLQLKTGEVDEYGYGSGRLSYIGRTDPPQ